MQHLKESDTESRIEFARRMKDHSEIVNKMWFSDESQFYLNYIVNKQNYRFWGRKSRTSTMRNLCRMTKLLFGSP